MKNLFLVSRRYFRRAIILLLIWFPSVRFSFVQAGEINQNSAPSAVTRACSANPVLGPSGKNKPAHKTKHPLPPEPPPALSHFEVF
jgi:hypothetical protein